MARETKTMRRFGDNCGGTVLQGLTGLVLILLLMSSAAADDVHDAYVAKEVAKLPKAGVALFGALPAERLKVLGSPDIVESSIVAPEGVPFGKARRVVVKKRGQFNYQAQLQAQNNTTPIHKGDLTLRVVDANGKPIKDARVKVEMKRHAYGFGSYIQHDIMGEMRPYNIVDLDVTNELRQWKDDLVKTVGREGVAEWFRMARQVAPNSILYLNDNTILTNGGRTKNEQDIYIDWLNNVALAI